MAEVKAMSGEGWLQLEFDEALYPKDAIYGAAYVFIDRCYVHLDRAAAGRVAVTLKVKAGVKAETAALLGEFENEALAQAWRRSIADENRSFIEAVTTRAIAGAAGPPGLDDLLSMDIGADTAFEDPLGIAMSWEEKYTKKKKAKDDDATAEPAVSASASPDAGASEKTTTESAT